MNTRKDSEFRKWLRQLWFEHQDEVFFVTGKLPDYSLDQYIKRYRWWLKHLYRKSLKEKV